MEQDDPLEGLKKYDFGAPIEAVERALPDGRLVVRLPDGSHAMAVPVRVVQKERECSTAALSVWLGKVESRYGRAHTAFLQMLCDDKRMDGFWAWVSGVNFAHPMMRNVTTISEELFRATRLPQKPGDMTPVQRGVYFEKVRRHAEELRKLLHGTMFDYTSESELQERDLEKTLEESLYHYGDDEDEEGHVVAYKVTPHGRFTLDWLYPYSELTNILDYLDRWTYEDDYFGRSIFHSSAPIRQANSESTPVIYFTCTVADFFEHHGVEIPASVLADVAEVCLQLSPDQALDADTVKRQVARYRQRRKRLEPRLAGQNFPEGRDFVLQGGF